MEELNSKIERVVLSAILFSPDKFDEINDFLAPSDFLFPLHSCMYKACFSLRQENNPITVETLCVEMQKSMKVNLEDLALIAAESPIADIDHYARIIKEKSQKRALQSLASYIRDESLRSDKQVDEMLNDVERKIYDLSIQNLGSDFQTAEQVVQKTLESIKENMAKFGSLKGINTGFHELNHVTTGFNPGELIIIGARPSMGKTALILSMALKVISSGKGIALFSLEMPATQLMARMLSAKSLVPLQSVRSGDVDDRELTKLSQASQELCSKNNFYIDDSSYLTLATLRTKLRKLKSKDNSVSIVMIDYLQLMAGVGIGTTSNNARHEIIADISRGLKNLARELEIPIIALSQLNRLLESRDDKRPILSDLRESGAIEQDADVIIFLYRDEIYKIRESRQRIANQKRKKEEDMRVQVEEVYKPPEIEEAELILAKNRNGETKTITIQYNAKYTLFEDTNEAKEIRMSTQNNTMLIDDKDIETIYLDSDGLPKIT